MAQDDTRSDLDRDEPETGEDVRGIGDEEFDEEEGGEDVEDEDQLEADEEPTGEVGSEGGSAGDRTTSRREKTDNPLRGSESTTTSRRER